MNIYFGDNIKSLRKKQNLTQESLADLLGVSFQAISKWERGESYPDISLLPVIANFFSVSIDDLLGVDKAKDEKAIQEYLELYDNNCSIERTVTFEKYQKAVKEYPNDYRILVRYMSLLLEEKDSIYHDDYEKTSKELMVIFDRIQNNCTNDDIRIWAKRNICTHLMKKYDCLGFDEKYLDRAKEIINSLPVMRDSRELMLLDVNRDIEKWFSIRENAIEEQLYLLQNTIIGYCYYENKFSTEYKIKIIENMNSLFKTFGNDQSKNIIHLIYNYGHLGHLYCEIGNQESAIENLRLAAELAKELDEHPDVYERIAKFYEIEKEFLDMTMCERMVTLMTKHYNLPESFKSTEEFTKIIDSLS